jgi:hypothetical protein
MHLNHGRRFQEKAFRRFLLTLKNCFDSHYLVSEIPQILSQIHRSKFILRHDVVSRMDAAVAMAEVEQSLNIRGTFLFDVSAPELSPEQHAARNHIQSIRNLKHEIGLHIPGSNPEIHRDVFISSRKLEKYLSKPVLSVSFAENKSALPPGTFFISGKISASSRLMMDWHVSDKTGDLTQYNPRPSEHRPMLQVIIHPENWVE